MSTLARLDGKALMIGITAALVIVVPAAVASILVIGTGDDGNDNGGGAVALVFFLAVIVGFGVGGHRVGRTGVELPVTHGGFVGLLAFGLVQVVILVGSAIVGREGGVDVVSLAISALLASSAGMIGASLAVRRAGWNH